MSRWRSRRGVAAIVLLMGPSALSAGPAYAGVPERITGAPPEEVEAFKATRDRFADRVREFEADTLASLGRQRDEQVAKVTAAYTARIDGLSASAASLRQQAIASFERFLGRYDDVRTTSEVRLRLAELLFQEAEDAWLAATDAYYSDLEAAEGDLARLASLEAQGEPRIDLSQVIRLLDSIVASNEGVPREEQYPLLDVAYEMLAFCYASPNSVQSSADKAHEVFAALIAARPDSDYADSAHLMRGLYFFQKNRFEDSIPEFQAVLAKGADKASRRNFEGALYQLAWARYKLSEYDEATALFVQLLDLSDRRQRETGRDSEYRPDAVAYLALSLIDQSDEMSVFPLERANAFFAGLGGRRAYRWDVLDELAGALVRYARAPEAIEVYAFLQQDPEFRNRPENPDFQNEVVRLLSRGYDADLVAAGQARLEMTERYSEGSAWWEANRANPDAQSRARRYIESYLLDVAREIKVRAQESGDKATYALAADKYRDYLDRFPMADDYFDNQFQLADAYYQAGQHADAEREFALLVRDARFHKYGDAALYLLFRTRTNLVSDKLGSMDQPVAGAEVAKKVTTPGGVELTIYELDPLQRGLLEAADAVLAHEYGPPVEGVDIGAIVKGERAKILYLPAQMLYYANDFEGARPRLQKIIKEMPNTDEALRAANLFLNTYITEGDNEAVRRWSREFATMRLGASSSLSSELSEKFQNDYEKLTYYLGTERYEAGDYLGAAEAYMAFIEEFPKSANVPDALLSAAFNYQRYGRARDANALYERFIREYPDHPEARPFYFAIASNYESTFELDRAIGFYEQYVKRFGDDPKAPDAQYMVAFLKEGLGEHLAAARGYEEYARRFPAVADREEVHYRAGKMYELVDADKAIAFYRSYLKAYGVANPDHALEAQARIADLYAQRGRRRDAEQAQREVVTLFDRIVDAGGTVNAPGRDAAAAAAFPQLQALFDKATAHTLSRNEKKDTELLFDTIPAEIGALDAAADAFIQRYLSFPYTTAAIYLKGAARVGYAKLGFSLQPPPGVDEDTETAYWELLEEKVFPQFAGVEAQAVQRFQEVIDLAKRQKRHSQWVDRAREGLHDVDGAVYPDVKQPIPGEAEAVQPPRISPLAPREEAP